MNDRGMKKTFNAKPNSLNTTHKLKVTLLLMARGSIDTNLKIRQNLRQTSAPNMKRTSPANHA